MTTTLTLSRITGYILAHHREFVLKVSQQNLSDRTGIPQSTIGRKELGSGLTLDELEETATAYGLDYMWVITTANTAKGLGFTLKEEVTAWLRSLHSH